MRIIDFHTHILSGIDDGSRDLNTSLKLLRIEKDQGIDTVVFTPHFYGWKNRIESLLDARSDAARILSEAIRLSGQEDRYPDFVVGSEVAFFRGISKAPDIELLTIEGTDTLLLEMPFDDWTTGYLDEVEKLAGKYTVVIAHLERYMTWGNRAGIRRLHEMTEELPIKIQINGEALLDRKLRHKVMKLFASGKAHILGSDCHSLTRRPPNLMAARAALEAFASHECLERVDYMSNQLIGRIK